MSVAESLPGLRARPVAIFAVCACLALAALVARNGLIEATFRTNPVAAAGVGARDPRVVAQQIQSRLELMKLKVTSANIALARELLTVAPLHASPLMVAGGQALQAGRYDLAIRRLEESRRRNPRNRITRLYLLEAYLRTMRLQQAGVEIAALSRLLGEARQVLVPVVASALVDPVIGPRLKDAVHGDAQLRSAVALAMVGIGASPGTIVDVGGTGPATDPEGRAWQTALLERLVAAGQVEPAYRLWQSFSGKRNTNLGLAFSQQGLAPFAWTYVATGDGVAEPSRNGGLDVTFYNRASTFLARRLVILQPGKWRLAMKLEGGPSRGQEPLSISLTCAGASTQLARIPLSIEKGGLVGRGGTFTVPANCQGQWINIEGTAQEFPTPRSMTISDLALRRVG